MTAKQTVKVVAQYKWEIMFTKLGLSVGKLAWCWCRSQRGGELVGLTVHCRFQVIISEAFSAVVEKRDNGLSEPEREKEKFCVGFVRSTIRTDRLRIRIAVDMRIYRHRC